MKFENNKKLDSKTTYAILQDTYDAIPQLLRLLAPAGWQESFFHQELMNYRKILYEEYLSTDENRLSGSELTIYFKSDDTSTEKKMSLEQYLYMCFPPLGNDYLELFYIVSSILAEITYVSNLYQDHEIGTYYFDEIAIEDFVIQLTYEKKQIDKDRAEAMVFAFPVPYLDDMEVHYCLEVLFSILMKHGFKLDYRHNDLLNIVDLQHMYQEILYSDLAYEDKERQREIIKEDISEVLRLYDRSVIDPLDLPAIIAIFNRREVCPLVLAYLHVYHEFPKGYPYLLTDYQGYL